MTQEAAALLDQLDRIIRRDSDTQHRLRRRTEVLRRATLRLRVGQDPNVVRALILSELPKIRLVQP